MPAKAKAKDNIDSLFEDLFGYTASPNEAPVPEKVDTKPVPKKKVKPIENVQKPQPIETAQKPKDPEPIIKTNPPGMLSCGHFEYWQGKEKGLDGEEALFCEACRKRYPPIWPRVEREIPESLHRSEDTRKGIAFSGYCVDKDGVYNGGPINDCRKYLPREQWCGFHREEAENRRRKTTEEDAALDMEDPI